MIKRPLYSNFARSTLASGISDTDTTMSVKVGEETRFPQPVREGDYFPVLIQKPDYSYEIVHCTDRTDEELTIERGKEGTSALSFSAGAVVMNVLTADTLAFYLNSYWAREEETPTQVDDSSFTLPGDKTDLYQENRALYLFQTSSGPGYVDSSSYDSDADETTVTVVNITVDSGLEGVDYGQDKRSAPRYTVMVEEASTAYELDGKTVNDLVGGNLDIFDKGTQDSSGATVTLDLVDGRTQRLKIVEDTTIETTGWPDSGQYAEMEIELVNGGAATITWPTIKWAIGDGSYSTNFADVGLSLRSSGRNWILIWTTDGGSTLYGGAI